VWANFLGLAEAGIALALFYGGLTRVAAAALGLLWFSGIFLVGWSRCWRTYCTWASRPSSC
jgi:uncharacterized membrane protein YphA (DoxX/SURF4 family)